uniref:Putative secreted protein n=1 Tax=Anopheles marajoara TaxID=58244 RepID=A0A2M4CB06_9DIPT
MVVVMMMRSGPRLANERSVFLSLLLHGWLAIEPDSSIPSFNAGTLHELRAAAAFHLVPTTGSLECEEHGIPGFRATRAQPPPI